MEHKMPMFFLVVALVGCALSISISFLLEKYNLDGYLSTVGYHYTHIYCMQIILMAATRTLLLRAFDNISVPIAMLLIVVARLIFTILFFNMFIKLNGW